MKNGLPIRIVNTSLGKKAVIAIFPNENVDQYLYENGKRLEILSVPMFYRRSSIVHSAHLEFEA